MLGLWLGLLGLPQCGLWRPVSPACLVHLQDSNSVESMNKVLKSSNYFDNVEGLGTVLTEFPRLLTRFSENARVS